jgi:hypothetical protein
MLQSTVLDAAATLFPCLRNCFWLCDESLIARDDKSIIANLIRALAALYDIGDCLAFFEKTQKMRGDAEFDGSVSGLSVDNNNSTGGHGNNDDMDGGEEIALASNAQDSDQRATLGTSAANSNNNDDPSRHSRAQFEGDGRAYFLGPHNSRSPRVGCAEYRPGIGLNHSPATFAGTPVVLSGAPVLQTPGSSLSVPQGEQIPALTPVHLANVSSAMRKAFQHDSAKYGGATDNLEGPWVTEEDFSCLANSRPIDSDCSFVLLFVLAALNWSCKLSCRLYSVEYSLIPLLLIAVNKAHEYDSGVSTESPKAKHAVEGARHVIATRSVLRDTLEWLILMLMSTSWTAHLYIP